MLELLIFISLVIFFIYLFINNIQLRKKNFYLLKYFSENQVALSVLEKQLETLENITEENLHQDHFLKFISDSRDVAFNYINEVQNKILSFENNIKVQIMENSIDDIQECCDQYEKLINLLFSEIEDIKRFLPKDESDGR